MSGPTFWLAANGDGVQMSDTVALAEGNGVIIATTVTGCPVIEVTAGQHTGEHLGVRPSAILSRITRARPRSSPHPPPA
ncbi:hypothetical protein Cme02nite_72550 [Catellatospora methionotrophica]|uniref:Uncharacterized protein n=1 Tax=Catellatospora methionotrophica TaxID=121620 RepID=A0A8J3LD87_9ACTN|nr:hypothetical protein [Catellatospora methionotrophica]GIG18923.1 hypothetical protein Cme02nite_72550 [Catellatospora methionotrophica]